ncbi:hypothetical protein QJQ45_020036 [Haematococcus lacustris]|nr:hypothetical protein QJQ45_020036 [Haematococcus lacustris]
MERFLAAADRLCLTSSVALDAAGAVELEEETEQVFGVFEAVELVFGEDARSCPGHVHVTSRRVVWSSSMPDNSAVVLRYPQIMMHAVSRDLAAFPQPCIYVQLDVESCTASGLPPLDNEAADEAEDEPDSELRLVPQDADCLEKMFQALCDCAALNPDSENEGEGDFYFDEAEVMAGLDPATRAALMAQQLQGGMALEDCAEGLEGGDGGLEQMAEEDLAKYEDDDEEDNSIVPGAADMPAQPAPHGNGHC